jgi:outer membrane putative beta-barrel porin/alpha-amylase
MLGRVFWTALALIPLFGTNAGAQNLCSTTASSKVACTVANVYGVNGLTNDGALAPENQHQGQFGNSFLSNLSALNSSIGTQLGELPLVSPASGISFSFNKALGILVPAEYNFGPILSERAGTLGRHKFLVGFSYQNFEFQTLDGAKLNNLPAVFTQQDTQGCSAGGNNTNACAFIRDVITTNNSIDLRVNQYTAFVSFGITDRFDVSVAVPTINVRLATTSVATIKNNGSDDLYQFQSGTTGLGCSPNPCFNRTFFNSNGATGIGDVTVRAKYEIWKGERAGFAAGADVRFPTGDALNYLGSGAYGVKPFGVLSFGVKRVAAHLNAGYEWNSASYLAGDITPSQANGTVAATKDNLPGQFFYSAGAEVGIFKRLSVAIDYLGQEIINAPRIKAGTFQELPACSLAAPVSSCGQFNATGATDPIFQEYKASYATANAAAGLRLRLFGHLLLTGNMVFKLNDAGLRSKYVPLAGITYSH